MIRSSVYEETARLGGALRTVREEFGLTLGALSALVGERPSWVSALERGTLPLSATKDAFVRTVQRIVEEHQR